VQTQPCAIKLSPVWSDEDGLRMKHFDNDDDVTVAVKKWLLKVDRKLLREGGPGFS
jgi:hypothetical protein